MPIYDEEGLKRDKLSPSDDLGGDKLKEQTSNVDNFRENARETRAEAGEATESDKKQAASRKDIASEESRGSTTSKSGSESDSGGDESDALNRPGFFKKGSKDDQQDGQSKSKRRKKLLIGLGAIGGTSGLAVFLFTALIPFKIVTMASGMQDYFGLSNESSLSARTEKLFDQYMKKHVLPGINTTNGYKGVCSSTRTIDKTCYTIAPGSSYSSRLFSAWKDARLENKLATNQGIEFSKTPGIEGALTMKIKGLDDVQLDNNFLRSSKGFADVGTSKVSTSQFRKRYKAALTEAMDNEVYLKKVFYRFKVGRLMERKYGIRRCIFACKTRDNFADWKKSKSQAAQLMILRRIVEPNTELVSIAMSCIVSGDCEDFAHRKGDDTERQNKLEAKLKANLEARGIQLADEQVEKLLALIPVLNELKELGPTDYIIQKTISTIIGDELGQKALPFIGQVNAISSIIQAVKNSTSFLRRAKYDIKAAEYITLFAGVLLTFADEIKSGNVDPELVASMNAVLSEDAGAPGNQGYPAESSPRYQEIFGATTTKVSFFNIFAPKTFAESSSFIHPPCDDGSPPKNNGLACHEEKVNFDGGILSDASAFLLTPPMNIVSEASDFWQNNSVAIQNKISGLVGAPLNAVLNSFPPFKALQDVLGKGIKAASEFVAKFVIPSAVHAYMHGARFFTAATGGAAMLAADTGISIGSRVLTAVENAQVKDSQLEIKRTQFASQSLFHRMFSKDDTSSMVSQVALRMPTSTSTMVNSSVASLLASPFGTIGSSFGSLFAKPKVHADNPVYDPLGVPYIGIPLDDPVLSIDGDILTDAYCNKFNEKWVDHEVFIDPTTGAILRETPIPKKGDPEYGIDVHRETTNPCLLEQATTSSAGGYLDTNLLAPGDIGTPKAATP